MNCEAKMNIPSGLIECKRCNAQWHLSEKVSCQKVNDNISTTNAKEFLTQAATTMAERGKQYDQPTGERSMARTVAAFNAITGHKLTEQDGWLFMLVLKQVRQWSTPAYHEDSALDSVAYAALLAECLAATKEK